MTCQPPPYPIEATPPDRAPTLRRRVRAALLAAGPDAGMTTAEYAVGTVAACGFAGLLYKVLTSGTTSALLSGLVERALSVVL